MSCCTICSVFRAVRPTPHPTPPNPTSHQHTAPHPTPSHPPTPLIPNSICTALICQTNSQILMSCCTICSVFRAVRPNPHPHPTHTPHPTRPHPSHPKSPKHSYIRGPYIIIQRGHAARGPQRKRRWTRRMTPVLSLSTQCVGRYLLAIPMLGASPGRTLCLTLCLCVHSVLSDLFRPVASWLVHHVACGGHAAELYSVQDSRAEKGKERKQVEITHCPKYILVTLATLKKEIAVVI